MENYFSMRENYYALLISIVNGVSVKKALMEMGVIVEEEE